MSSTPTILCTFKYNIIINNNNNSLIGILFIYIYINEI